MNICFIGPQVMKTVSGGVWTQVSTTADTLSTKGHTVEFYNYWKDHNWANFDIIHLFKADYETYNIAKWLHESKLPFIVSPVFFNSHKSSSISSVLLLSRLFQKFVTGMRTDFDFVKEVCSFSHRVLPNTHVEGKLIEKGMHIPGHKIHTIPNAVEERFGKADPKLFEKKYGIRNFILSIGNFGYARKNMLKLIQVLKQINHPAVLIGTIYNNSYGMLCKKQLEMAKNILWIDAIAHDDPLLASAYAACDVFALPSLFETPGLTALEAALAGAKIVITPHGGPKEYFGNMATYIDPNETNSIKEGIVAALQDGQDPNLKEHILKNYSYPVIAEKLLKVYQETIDTLSLSRE